MKSIFFLIPLLLIVTPSVFAEIEKGVNYDKELLSINPNGQETYMWTSTPERLYNGFSWVDFIQVSSTEIDTAHGKVKLNTDGSFTFFNSNNIPLWNDKIIGKYADISDLTLWTYPNNLNDQTPINSWNGTSLISEKENINIGNLKYIYVSKDGKWKTQLEVTNLAALTTKVFGFDQILDLNRDTINFAGVQRNLDNFDGSVFDHDWIVSNQAEVINFMNGFNFNLDIAIDDLHSITVFDTGINSSQLVFDYRMSEVLLPDKTFIIDPTFAYTSGTRKVTQDAAGVNANCLDSGFSDSTGTAIIAQLGASGSSHQCRLGSFEWNTSSIPDSSTITDVDIRYDSISTNSNPLGCDFTSMETKPSASTDEQHWNDVGGLDGTTVEYVNNNLDCKTIANNYLLDLGSSAVSDLQGLLNSDWFAVGIRQEGYPVRSALHQVNLGTTELQVIYTTPPTPDAILSLTSTSISNSGITLDWTEPNLYGESLIGYQINYTTPQSTTVKTTGTIFLNDTGTIDDTVTDLTSGTEYSFTVSAWTLGGNNVTNAFVYNATTTSGASIPTGLTVTDISISQLDLNWDDAPAYDNITGFRIFEESPTGNGFIKLVNDTGTSTSEYSHTTLSTKSQHNYMIAGINATGIGGNSTAVSAYTFGVPDAISDLSLGSTSSTITLTWSAPTIYGYTITGYFIEYESPVGNGWVTLVADTGTTDITYIHTGLTSFTQYNYRVTAITSFGNSATSNEISAYTVTDPPTSLILNDGYHIYTTQLDLNWIAPTGTITGYKIECESPTGNGFSDVVANTTTTTVFYNYTGLTAGQGYNCRISAHSAFGTSSPSNEDVYSPHRLPESIPTLSASETSLSSIILSWVEPLFYSHELLGYQINFTTPLGDPLTPITNNTGSLLTSAEITSLSLGSPNSFRVSAVTDHGRNTTFSNIINASAFSPYIIGEIPIISDPNFGIEDVLFTQVQTNTTTVTVTVRYPNTVSDFRCDIAYTFAQTNQTYSGLTATAYDTNYDQSDFVLYNADNEIIDFDCWDYSDPTINGQHQKAQNAFPFIDLADDFRAGSFGGLSGDFGGIDLITLIVIIVSMAAFNTRNPAAGVIISVMVIGATSYFGLITIPTTVISALVLVILLAVIVTRK